MSKHEDPMIRRWFATAELSCRWALNVPLVKKSGNIQRREMDAVAVLDDRGRSSEMMRDQLPSLRGRDVVVVQAKASPLAIRVASQAIGSAWLAERAGAASVRSVALCTSDDPYLRPLLEARGIEVAIDGERRGSRAKVHPAADRIAAWSTLQDDPIRTSVPLVVDGSLVAHAVVFHDGAPSAPTVADLAGSEITVVTTLKPESKGGDSFGMSPIGMAVLNRELAQQAGAVVRRTVILSPAVDPVMGQLCEHLGVDTELTPA